MSNSIKKEKVTKSFLKDLKEGKVRVQVPPVVRRLYPDIKYDNVKALSAFLEKLPKDLVVLNRGFNFVVIPIKQFEQMDKHLTRRANTESKNVENKKAKDTIWDKGNDLIAIFPEIEQSFNESKTVIDKAGCTGCASRGRENKLIGELAKLHVQHPERELPTDMINLLGAPFGRAVSRLKYKKAPYGSIAVPTETKAHKLLEPVLHTHYTQGVRPSCLDCCRKHLGQAIVLLQESDIEEYQQHFWLGLGHLAEVESESMSSYPYFAKQIRDIRLAMMAKKDYVPNLMDLFDDMDILEFGEQEDNGKNTE